MPSHYHLYLLTDVRGTCVYYVVEVLQCPAVRVDQVISPVSEVCDLGGARDLGGRDAGSA